MSKIIIMFCNHLHNIGLSLNGIPIVEQSMLKDENDFYILNIPTYSDDKKNLQNDRDAVSADLIKAVEEKELQARS